MDKINGIKGVYLTDLKIIKTEKGEVRHFIRNDSKGFHGFGEAYFSKVNYKEIKGWKKHKKMIMNLTVPVGEIMFYLFDENINPDSNQRKIISILLSSTIYKRLTISPGLWVAFEGKGKNENILLNLSDIPHDPNEAINLSLDDRKFKDIEYKFYYGR